ncbi:MAG: leucine-rich repeat protein [Eubacteriales bacterium]
MKKILCFAMILLLSVSLVSCLDGILKESVGLAFTLNDDGESYSVTGLGTCTDTDIVIPKSYEGKPVTGIGRKAFSGCIGLTSVTIGNGVTSIGDRTFFNCKELASVTIPDSVTSIGDWAFYGCGKLTSLTIPDSVTSIGGCAFSNCGRLEIITVSKGNTIYHSAGNCLIETGSKTLIAGFKNSVIPDDGSVTSIGNNAFYECSGLTSITIPDSVTSIGECAFFNCNELASVTIGNSTTSIGFSAFSRCSGLTSVTIPDSVTSIGLAAFFKCSGLTDIHYKGTKAEWNAIEKFGDWNDYTGSYTIHCTDGDLAKE